MGRALAIITLSVIAMALSRPAAAHATSTSFVLVTMPDAAGEPVPIRWDLSMHDIVWAVFIDRNFDGVVTWEEVQSAKPTIASAVLGEIRVKRGGATCKVEFRDVALAVRSGQNYLSVMLAANCPTSGLLEIGGSLFMTGAASQRVLLSVARGSAHLTGVLGAESPLWREPLQPSAWKSFVRFIVEGIRHVLAGYDHVAFVLLLLLPSVLRQVGGRWESAAGLTQVARDIVTIVTAFTIAHSTTLALAVTGTVKLPPQPIEVAIAASIAAAGLLNLLPNWSRLRLPLAFGFGFVHGFGFANALSEIDASGTALLPLLAGFNIGVEIAQLAIVAVVLPLIYSMRQRRWYSGAVMPLGSCALGTAGLVWLIQRL